jgi:hypothetical protein
MDFNPIIPSNEDKSEGTNVIIDISVDNKLSIETYKEPLSIANLVLNTQGHMLADAKCVIELELVSKELHDLISKMSVKELLEYQKNIIAERKFHADSIKDSLNFTLKTEYAKHLLVGTKNGVQGVRTIKDKDNIRSLANILKRQS